MIALHHSTNTPLSVPFPSRSSSSTILTNEVLPVLAVTAVYNPEMLEVYAGNIHGNEPRNTASPEVSAVPRLETLQVLTVSAVRYPGVPRARSTCCVLSRK